jgi:hypothetical protein
MEMKDALLLGIWKYILRVPSFAWKSQISDLSKENSLRLDFMTEEHHRVRDFVVTEIAAKGVPLTPAHISQALQIKIRRVTEILNELESHMTFLYRNPGGEVIWAYPVTAQKTPHKLVFSTGEGIYAA